MRLVACAVAALIGLWAAPSSASIIADVPIIGPPTTSVTITGTTFGASEAVDVYLDTTDTLLLVTTSAGGFTGAVTIPASATPGKHYITAIGRKSGDSAQVAFTVQTNWSQLGYGQNRLGWNPYENVLSANNAQTLGVLWDIASNGTGATPVFFSGKLFVATQAGVVAYNAANGATMWTQNIGTTWTTPTVANDAVYVQTSNGIVYSLNVATGKVNWSKTLGGIGYSSVAFLGGALYVANGNTLYALSAATGAITWSFATGATIEATPTIVNGAVYICSLDNSVYALRASDGTKIWQFTTQGGVEDGVTFANGVVYVGSDDKNIYALNANSGGLLWSYTTGSWVYDNPVVAYGAVYVGSMDGMLYTLGAGNGALRWSAPASGQAAVANGVVYTLGINGNFAALNATTGAPLASASVLSGSFEGGPSVANGVVYVSGYTGDTLALAPGAGTAHSFPIITPPRPRDLLPNLSLTPMRS